MNIHETEQVQDECPPPARVDEGGRYVKRRRSSLMINAASNDRISRATLVAWERLDKPAFFEEKDFSKQSSPLSHLSPAMSRCRGNKKAAPLGLEGSE